MNSIFQMKSATVNDIPLILSFIKELADYEKLPHEVLATEEVLRESLFGEKPVAEVLLGYLNDEPVSFLVFFHNFSTFLGKPGLYLEDIFVRPEARGKGIGQKMLAYLAHLAQARNCGRMEWSVLDWNEPAINFYQRLGAKPMSEWTVYRVTDNELNELAAKNSYMHPIEC
ncbi:MAG: GNAT family N-acetyltransferase [Gammaproteobacteria bacterium]|nr:GNAT family N-acetyltransferase [Gammaproteobacteria bacterium]MCW5582577.1 GNAT family N-acetyltransferase [Gammaproteobacteria bacterium]